MIHINHIVGLQLKKQRKLSLSGTAVSTQSSHSVFLAKVQMGDGVTE